MCTALYTKQIDHVTEDFARFCYSCPTMSIRQHLNLTTHQRKIAFGLLIGGVILILVSIGTIALAVHLENQDESCAACHTEPETTYFERTQANQPVDLASAHAHYEPAVRCIDCHSGYGTGGRVMALYQGMEDLLLYASGRYQDPAITTSPLGDAPCLKCHAQPSQADGGLLPDNPQVIQSTAHYHWLEYTSAWLEAEPNPHGVCGTCHLSHAEAPELVEDFATAQVTCDNCHRALVELD